MIDPSFIMFIRSEYLTVIFKLFPFFASSYFYITVIALGYWLNPASILFRSLGFLVPFSTLLNCLLKSVFKMPRPDLSLHLLPVHDPFGFPSGDVQVATVFWMLLFLNLKNYNLRYLCMLPVVGIALSRVYLGVHDFYDVIGGLVFGLGTLCVWEKYMKSALITRPLPNCNLKFWILLIITIALYALLSQQLKWPPMVPISIGVLIGFGLVLKYIQNPVRLVQRVNLPTALISLILLVITGMLIPTVQTNEISFYVSVMVKYVILTLEIYVLIPVIMKRFKKFGSPRE